MAGFYNLDDSREVIHVKVKKHDGKKQPELKKFSIDPQITSFDMLQGILARAFEINSDFTVSYLTRDCEGQVVYQSMLSDWDMDAAFQCAAEPYLKLRVDVRSFEDMEDWDVIAPVEIPHYRIPSFQDRHSILGSIADTIAHNIGRTVDSVQKAIGFKHQENEILKPIKAPMSVCEFNNYLDSAGCVIKPNEFRQSVYQGGIEPSLRRVAWRHLLNIYPVHMSAKDRLNYLKWKEQEYVKLRDKWRERLQNQTAVEEVKHVIIMVKKDVLRTDRSHNFYAGSDENANIVSLFHILVTYALTHPDVSYCQGMSDLASPLLFTQRNEGQAYICFCALMSRLCENFTAEGRAIMLKFHHLSELLNVYDPFLFTHFQKNSAGDLFFCYRWLLLEMKREFPLNDALTILEVMWATMPPNAPEWELPLVDPHYFSRLLSATPCSPTLSNQHSMYTKLLAMRRVGGLHKAMQPEKLNACPVPRTSANNNMSTESSPCSDNQRTNQNVVNSCGTSSGYGETDFLSVSNSLTCSVLQKFKGMNVVFQKEGLYEDHAANDEFRECECRTDNARNDNDWISRHLNDSFNTRSNTFKTEQYILSLNNADFNHGVPADENYGINVVGENCNLEANKRSWSLSTVASDSSETYDQQIQFTLSLESDNLMDTSNAVAQLNYYVSSSSSELDSGRSDTKFVDSGNVSRIEAKKGGFQNNMNQKSSKQEKTHGMLQSLSQNVSLYANKNSKTNPVIHLATEKGGLNMNFSDSNISDCQEATEELGSSGSTNDSLTSLNLPDFSKLPPPEEFGCGNPFLMFLCLTLLVQHRDTILNQGMCYEDIAMYFDRLVRKHNSNTVLHLARQIYTEYLRAQHKVLEEIKDEDVLDFSC